MQDEKSQLARGKQVGYWTSARRVYEWSALLLTDLTERAGFSGQQQDLSHNKGSFATVKLYNLQPFTTLD